MRDIKKTTRIQPSPTNTMNKIRPQTSKQTSTHTHTHTHKVKHTKKKEKAIKENVKSCKCVLCCVFLFCVCKKKKGYIIRANTIYGCQ